MDAYQRMWHHPRCTKIYSVRKFASARVRNFYAYENFCDYSKSEQQHPSSSSTLAISDRSGAWISSHFRIQVRSADECVAPWRRQPRETRWTSDGRLSSPETNLKVGLLPLFFMQLLLSHMFLSFMVRTSPLMVLGGIWGGGGGGKYNEPPFLVGIGLKNSRQLRQIGQKEAFLLAERNFNINPVNDFFSTSKTRGRYFRVLSRL